MSDTPKAQLEWLIGKTCEVYMSLRSLEEEHGPSADACLEAAQRLAVTVFIEAAMAKRKAPKPPNVVALPQGAGDASPLPQQTGDYVPKPRNVSAYCGCDHECWREFSEAYDGCACEPGACLSQHGKACGCIRPLPQMRGKVRMVADPQNEGRWRWVEAAA